jgi:rod shape-determining protein MreC
VGKVTEVYAESALVLPILDPAVYVAARLAESRYEGLVNGNGQRAGNLLMRYVDRQARFSVESSDLVVTSGMRSIYPAGLRIGMVTAIQGRSYESSLEIDLDPIVDFPRLEYVFVLVPGGAQ